MTLLRLIGRLAQNGVSDAIPEWVTFHSAYREAGTHRGREDSEEHPQEVEQEATEQHIERVWLLLILERTPPGEEGNYILTDITWRAVWCEEVTLVY